jgi:hypothetical protein
MACKHATPHTPPPSPVMALIAGSCTTLQPRALQCLLVNSTTRSVLAIPSNALGIASWVIGRSGARAPSRAARAPSPAHARTPRRRMVVRRARIALRHSPVTRTHVLWTAHGTARGQPGARAASHARKEPRVSPVLKHVQRCRRRQSSAVRRVRRRCLHKTVMIISAPSTALSTLRGASGASAPSRAKQAPNRVQGRSHSHSMVAGRVPTRLIVQYGSPKNARSNFARSIARSPNGRAGSRATLYAARASRRARALWRYPPSTAASAARISSTKLTAVVLSNAPLTACMSGSLGCHAHARAMVATSIAI